MHWWILDVGLIVFGIAVLALTGLFAFSRFKTLKKTIAQLNEKVAGVQAQVEALPKPHGG